jgi:DNA transformation protein
VALDAEALKELFEPFGAVVVKRMFGGHGIYADGLCFAIEADGEVFLKSDAESEAHYLAAGSRPFVYAMKGKALTMAYWRLPSPAYDDADELRRWADVGLAAARRAALAKGTKKSAPGKRVAKAARGETRTR